MTKQEIAKGICKLNWGTIQCCGEPDGSYYDLLKGELLKLSNEDAITVLFAVIEAQNLPDDFMGEDRIMYEFKYL